MSLHLPKIISACVLVCATTAANACGPFFPNQVIAGSGANLLQIPKGQFFAELDRLQPAGEPPFKAVGAPQFSYQSVFVVSANIDQADLVKAMSDGKISAPPGMLDQYKAARDAITKYTQALEAAQERGGEDERSKVAPLSEIAVPIGLPAEFDLYLRGLIAFHCKDLAGAQKAWKQLLALPADQRKYRSTWAAFMLGKMWMWDYPEAARTKFELVRDMAGKGFVDSLGLASSSLGWQAKIELQHGKYDQAIGLYLQQRWTGDATAEASLRECAEQIFDQGPAALAVVAADPTARQVMTAYITSGIAAWYTITPHTMKLIPVWLAAVESAAVKQMPGADRLAWVAYSSGDFAAAERWISRSPADSVIAQWVRAKLLLRDGKNDEAAAVLVKVVRSFPQSVLDQQQSSHPDDGDPQPVPRSVLTDLGVLQLARGQYVDSMHLLMMSDHWRDAAYIAERVLTPDELKTFVDRYCPPNPAQKNESLSNMRLLLARRLTRAGQWKQAKIYFTPDLRIKLDQYVEGIRAGHDKSQSDADRAAAYMTAARIACKDGMDLLGTELDPDFHWYGGSFRFDDTEARMATTGPTCPTDDEVARVEKSAPADPRRFHYRYTAAGHAWSAAELLPDGSEETARVLNEAGCWLKDRDPGAADQFYKALVHRCADTDLGKRAAAAHWFPKNPG